MTDDNWSKTPNWLFAEMPTMTEGVLKLTMHVCRQTRGWKREWAQISYSHLEDATGMSRPAVRDSIKLALEAGYIRRREAGNSFEYALGTVETVNSSNQLNNQTSSMSEPKVVNSSNQFPETGSMSEPKVVNSSNQQTLKKERKLTTKKGKEREGPADADQQQAELPEMPQKDDDDEPDQLDEPAYMDTEPVTAYRDTFELTPKPKARKAMTERVDDLDVWAVVIEMWDLNPWDPTNVAAMLDRYDNERERKRRRGNRGTGAGGKSAKRKRRSHLTPEDKPEALESF